MDLDYQHETGLEIVRDVLDDFLPDISFSRIDKQRGRLLFKTNDGIVPLRSLGDGYQSVAAWIGDLLYRVMEVFDDYRSPLEARGLLLIDEVDLHFHPKWQQELFSFLSTHLPNFQLIVTTHSPMVAQQAGPGHLHYVKRDDVRIKIQQFTGNPRHLLVNQILMSEAFDLESDESWEVQEKKARYCKLREQEQLSADEREELDQLTTELSARPVGGRSNLRLQEEEVELLRQIQKELQERKS
jgi:predicted ATP-binding protein involved in virulence